MFALRCVWVLIVGWLTLSAVRGFAQDVTYSLQEAPAPVDNPLKGLVPYAGEYPGRFPHSMEFNYVSLGALVRGPDQYDWQPMEELLNEIAGRGHQAVFRIYLEYPGKKGIIPQYLVAGGLKVHRYVYTETQPEPPQPIETPDYEDPRLREMLRKFIAAFGTKYDGDPRIGFITAGLLGTWGEWHTYPREELFASKTVQAEVMDAYEAAFKTTRVLLRYPANAETWGKATNALRPFGYHDDSFAWATLDTGKKSDDWYFVPAMNAAGTNEKWRTQPIGGEIRPEAWGQVFDPSPRNKRIQNFRQCVDATHVTWLMDTGLFEKKPSAERLQRAEIEVRRMGYEYHISRVQMSRKDEQVTVQLALENRGVAPFYYDWPIEFGVLDGKDVRVVFQAKDLTLRGILPQTPREWSQTLKVKLGSTILLRVPNPLRNGHPVRFANREQDRDAKGWVTLGNAP